MRGVRILPLGDTALTVEFGDAIDPGLNERVRALHALLARENIPGVVETVPTYRSLAVHYRPDVVGWAALAGRLEALAADLDAAALPPAEVVEIPVLYGGEGGPDLDFVARHSGLPQAEVVARHTGTAYRIYMLGFAPGFPYLGGMDKTIAAPRLETPRVHIPAGSVGIAGEQTGVYPLDSPGGWRLIGATPLRLYDPGREQPILLRAGQTVRFYSITEAEYRRLREADRGEGGAHGHTH